MRLYSYIVVHDTGFAPNPFWGYCTLANCKPKIRKTACEGDWVVGLSPRARGNQIIYAMQVDEILGYDAYYNDPRFSMKIPDVEQTDVVYRCGDNCYEPLGHGEYRQLESTHSDGPNERYDLKVKDLSGRRILVSSHFHYFGSHAIPLPEGLEALIARRGHKCRFSTDIVHRFVAFISRHPEGVGGPPHSWPSHDQSWDQSTR